MMARWAGGSDQHQRISHMFAHSVQIVTKICSDRSGVSWSRSPAGSRPERRALTVPQADKSHGCAQIWLTSTAPWWPATMPLLSTTATMTMKILIDQNPRRS